MNSAILMWAAKMAWRDSRTFRRRLLLYTASIALGVAALVGVGSLGVTMEAALAEQANGLLGTDLALESRQPFSAEAEALIDSVGGEQARQTKFSSMVLFASGTRLVEVRALEPGFPHYGSLKTQPSGAAADFRRGRNALVDAGLMVQYGAEVGDSVKVGALRFQIAGGLKAAPGEAAVMGSVEPRVYIPMEYLEATGLVQKGSRIEYEVFIRLPGGGEAAEAWVDQAKPLLRQYNLRAQTAADRQNRLGRTLSNLYRFLRLSSFVALLLGGVGIASAIHSYVEQKRDTVAVLRSLGATSVATAAVYLVQAAAMGLVGAVSGALLGAVVVYFLPVVLQDFLPIEVEPSLAFGALAQGFGMGLALTLVFAALPLARVRRVSPLRALRASYEEGPTERDPLLWLLSGVIGAAITVFALAQTRVWVHGFGFALGVGGAFGALALVARGLIWGVRRYFPSGWSYIWRQGLANLYRPHNQTLTLVVSLGLGTFLIATLYLVQGALLGQVARVGGEGQPSLVLFDIQSDQVEPLAELMAEQGFPLDQRVPVVAMRLAQVKGQTVEVLRQDSTRRRNRWALRREYRSTYREGLTDTETLVAGAPPGRVEAVGDTVFVSLEERIARNLQVEIGDELVFDVQGVEVPVVVGSVRQVDWRRVSPNFFVVFPLGVLEEAPQFHVFVSRAPDAESVARLQLAAVQAFPNVSIVDLHLILRTINDVLDKVALVIRFMALFSVATGWVVLVGVVAGSRYQRIRESVLLKTLGASRNQVLKISALEYFFLGVFGALVGLVLAVGGTWALSYFVFEIEYSLSLGPVLVIFALVSASTLGVGLSGSRGIHRRSPLEVLRNEG